MQGDYVLYCCPIVLILAAEAIERVVTDSEKVAIGRRFTSQTLFLVLAKLLSSRLRAYVRDERDRRSHAFHVEENATTASRRRNEG